MYRDSMSVCGGSGLQGELGCTPVTHSSSPCCSLFGLTRTGMLSDGWPAVSLRGICCSEKMERGAPEFHGGLYSFISFRDSVGGGAGIAFSHDISIHLYKWRASSLLGANCMSALSASGSGTLKSMLSGQGNKIIAYLKNLPGFRIWCLFCLFVCLID